VAETTYGGRRLIVRRTRLVDIRQARLWPDWRHFGFLTDLDGTAVDIDAFHRSHASIELAIRDLKEGSGLEHCPSGNFSANSAWLQAAVLAHNLIRWTATIGQPVEALTVARTVRTRLLAVPARIVNRSGTLTFRGPARWPWADLFSRRLATIRALPVPI
jgi:Transposase DDE domain group 1